MNERKEGRFVGRNYILCSGMWKIRKSPEKKPLACVCVWMNVDMCIERKAIILLFRSPPHTCTLLRDYFTWISISSVLTYVCPSYSFFFSFSPNFCFFSSSLSCQTHTCSIVHITSSISLLRPKKSCNSFCVCTYFSILFHFCSIIILYALLSTAILYISYVMLFAYNI